MEHQVRGGRGQRAARKRYRIGAHGGRHQDTAAGDRQAGGRVERNGGCVIEAKRVDGQRRGADSGQQAVIDVSTGRVGRGVGRVGRDLSGCDGGKICASIDGRITAKETAEVGQIRSRDRTGSPVENTKVDGATHLTSDSPQGQSHPNIRRLNAARDDGAASFNRRGSKDLRGSSRPGDGRKTNAGAGGSRRRAKI